jgi:hypothetical protein
MTKLLRWVAADLLASHFKGNAAFTQQLCRKAILFSQRAPILTEATSPGEPPIACHEPRDLFPLGQSIPGT